MNTVVFPEAVVGKLLSGAYVRADEVRTRISMLEQQLAGEKKAAGYWMEQSCKDHNRAEKAEQQLSRYQGGVEVEGVISEFGDILLTEPSPIDIGQRVCALVKEVE